tara:strand:+ start:5259 stop:6050 length:792 start_codon:yes stop_codon:yes gene_type:complete
MTELSIGLSFLAGLASFVSPCVFALVPVYISYISGHITPTTDEHKQTRSSHKWRAFTHGLAFVSGFSLVFVSLGAAASTVGTILYNYRQTLSQLGGITILFFGLHVLEVIKIPWLYYDTRPHHKRSNTNQAAILSSFLMGIFFSAGWSPCVGPVLGAMLTLALTSTGLSVGVQMLVFYSLGLAVPFLLSAVAIDKIMPIYRQYSKKLKYIQQVNGIFLIVLGVLLFTGSLSIITIQLSNMPALVDLQNLLDDAVINIWNSLSS